MRLTACGHAGIVAGIGGGNAALIGRIGWINTRARGHACVENVLAILLALRVPAPARTLAIKPAIKVRPAHEGAQHSGFLILRFLCESGRRCEQTEEREGGEEKT